jgi:hypothetical protein
MNVAIDVDCLPLADHTAPEHRASHLRYDTPAAFLEAYATNLVRILQTIESPVDRVVIVTRPENHAKFEPLRDERTEIAVLRRPLFEGHAIDHWPTLLDRHPRIGAELLCAHQQEKLRLMNQLGVEVLHFPTDARELMEIDAPVALTLHTPTSALSATLADAIVVHCRELYPRLDLPRPKIFCAPWPSSSSSDQAGLADDQESAASLSFADALGDAYEHALASYELRKAA